MVSERDIFKAACGINEEQESNSIIRVEAKILHLAGGGSEETVSDLTMDNPCVSIHRSYRYTLIDLEFDDNSDPDLIRLSDMLRGFTVPEESMDVENDRIPAIILTVMPKAFDGEYFICGMHGVWCLMPSENGRPVDTVRFIFDNELVHTYQINADALDQDEGTDSEEREGKEHEEA